LRTKINKIFYHITEINKKVKTKTKDNYQFNFVLPSGA